MEVIKFDSNNKPEFVRKDYLINDLTLGIQQWGYWVATDEGEVQLVDGDYILTDKSYSVIKLVDYQASTLLKQQVRTFLGQALVRDLFKAMQDQNLSDADESALITKVATVLVALQAGAIRGARVLCNALTTTAVYTQARKTYMLNQIDAAIAKL